MTPNAKVGQSVDRLLRQAGRYICDTAQANIHEAHGVVPREFPASPGSVLIPSTPQRWSSNG